MFLISGILKIVIDSYRTYVLKLPVFTRHNLPRVARGPRRAPAIGQPSQIALHHPNDGRATAFLSYHFRDAHFATLLF